MRTREFEEYARNQLIINLSMLAIVVSCAASVFIMLRSVF